MLTRNQEKAIREYVLANLDDDTKRLIRLANYDLHYGPVTEPDDGEPWPGFVRACNQIRIALSVGDLYLDSQSDGVTNREPQWCEGCDDDECEGAFPEDWIHVDSRDVLSIAVGRELAPYVR